jgi:hypothetical protein
VLVAFRELFVKRCAACEARDVTIALLQQELHSRDEKWENEVRIHHDDMNDIIKHITGMNRVARESSGEMHSIPRNINSMGARIRHAERKDAQEATLLSAKRRADYEARIQALEKPEVEVMENGVQ